MKKKMGDEAWALLEKYSGNWPEGDSRMTMGMAAAPDFEAHDRSGLRHAAFLLDRGIGLVTESVGAVIVVAETFILFAGVVSPLRLQQPDLLDRRAGEFPVPVALDARDGGGVAR